MGRPLENLPYWPAALTESEALDYTRVSAAQLKEWKDRGVVRFVLRGANGSAIASREALDAAVKSLFARGGANDDPIPFD